MKWIKATERLPEKPGCYYIRDYRYSHRVSVSWYHCKGRGQSLLLRYPNDIEWLDENATDEKFEHLEKQVVELLSESGFHNVVELKEYFQLINQFR